MNKRAFWSLSYGIYLVSVWDNDRPTGCIANSVMQITSEPATVAISINHDNYTNSCFKKSGRFAVSILGEKCDPSVIGTFGFKSGRDTDKFTSVEHEIHDGMTVVSECCAYITCEVIDSMETETHTVFLGRVTDADVIGNDTPMTYSYYHKVIKGKSPKNAPTYIAEEKNNNSYICSVCGYVYDGEIPFEDLPSDYTCPVCGQPKSVFKKQTKE